jgi:nucleoside-diphosphate-sugar epimerase
MGWHTALLFPYRPIGPLYATRAACQPGTAWFLTPKVSWVHVDDVADVFARVLPEPQRHNGETYCVADEHRLSATDVFAVGVRKAGHTGPLENRPITEAGAEHTLFDRGEVVVSSKARRQLG